jgi:F-type H+-transporting ATPase subunit b
MLLALTHLFHIPTGLDDPTTWVLLALVMFIGLVIYLKVPGMATKALDDRAATIKTQLEDARKMRDEAKELLASFQRRQKEAESEAEAIIQMAHQDAERMAEEARAKLDEQLARRAQLAERKIAQAEADAEAAVRVRATELAITATEKILAEQLDDAGQAKLIDDGVKELDKAFG